jgi:polyhydroxyalkanoate synthesis regulator protein
VGCLIGGDRCRSMANQQRATFLPVDCRRRNEGGSKPYTGNICQPKEKFMVIIRKYANGRFYDTVHQRPVTKDQLAKLITNRRKIKVIFTQTGEDITRKVVSQLAPAAGAKKEAARFVDQLKKWFGDQMNRRMQPVLQLMNLPHKDQVVRLKADMDKIAGKIDELKNLQAQRIARMQDVLPNQPAAPSQAGEQLVDKLEIPSPGPGSPQRLKA